MKKGIKQFCCVCALLAILLCVSYAGADTGLDNRMVIDIPESAELITKNPGKGWVRYGTSNTNTDPVLSQKALDYSSMAYNRWNWYEIEPNEGEYDWSSIDKALEYWDSHGIKLAFGIMNSNSSNTNKFITPQWVFDAGAKYFDCTVTPFSGKPFIQAVPDWDDPIYKQKLADFVNAMAERYDGDPRVAWVEIRSFGNYGEWHLGRLTDMVMPSSKCQTELAQIYVDAFKKTKLVITREALRDGNVGVDYAINNNIGVRHDGAYIYIESSMKQVADKVPTCSEMIQPYKTFISTYGTFDRYRYLNFFNIFKQSYMDLGEWGDNTEAFINDNEDLIKRMTNKMGYHFVLKNASFPTKVQPGESFTADFEWLNKGVTYLYEDCNVAVAVLDSANNVVKKFWSNAVPTKNWASGVPVKDSVQIDLGGLADGEYTIAVGLFTDANNANPDYKIGNYARSENGWYPVAAAVGNNGVFTFDGCVKQININGEISGAKVDRYGGEQYLPISIFKNVATDESGNLNWVLDGTEMRVDANGNVYVNGAKTDVANPSMAKGGAMYISSQVIKGLGAVDYKEDSANISITNAKSKYNDFERVGKIVNQSFELDNNSWSYDDRYCTVTDEDSTDGKYSMKLDNKSDSAAVYQTVPMEPNSIYSIDFDVKTDAQLTCSAIDASGKTILQFDILSTNGEWKKQSLQVDSVDVFGVFYDDLAQDSSVTLKIESAGGGEKAYLDNFVMEKKYDLEQFTKSGYLVDYGAEVEIQPWRTRGEAALKREFSVANTGSYSFNLKYNGQWGGAQADVMSVINGREAGKYRFEFYARTDYEDLESILVVPCKITTSDGKQLETKSKYVKLTGEWQKFEVDFEITQEIIDASDNIESAVAIIGNGNLNNVGKSIYFDDTQLTKID